MRIPSGKTDIYLYFVALDTALTTRVTGLSTWTVYRSRNGGTATAYTTPTVTEISAANMPGVYGLLVDEDTTIASTSDSEEYTVHITATGMAPVTRTVEFYRREVTTGTTLTTADVTAIKAKTDSLTFTTALRVDSQVYGMQAGTVTAAAIATDAIDDDAIATGAIASTAFAAGAITATAIATDAIGSTQLAASAVTEINTGVATSASITTLQADTDDIQARLPAALVGGRMDASVGAMAANVITAAATAVDFTTEVTAGLATAASITTLTGYVDTEVAAILAAVDTEVAAIKAKTDSLTFTVAGQVDANIQSVNEVTVTGSGTGGSPWGP